MKSIIYFGCAIFLLVGLSSCTLEKRHYRNGFYVDWNRGSAEHVESSTLSDPVVSTNLPDLIAPKTDSSSSVVYAEPAEKISLIEDHKASPVVIEKHEQETPREVTYNPEKTYSALPIEKDKKQAVGAGIAAAIFFILGMLGLIIKGTAPPTGIFIGAAFVCFLLCVILASFLYPREPDPKNPDKPAPGSVTGREVLTVGLIFLAIGLAIVGGFFAFLWLIFNW